MNQIILILRSKTFPGNIGHIISAFSIKKANYKFFELPHFEDSASIFELFCLIRESMLAGEFLILNIDPISAVGEYGKKYDLDDILSL